MRTKKNTKYLVFFVLIIVLILLLLWLLYCRGTKHTRKNELFTNNNKIDFPSNPTTIHLWQGERDQKDLEFMYKPFILSIKSLLANQTEQQYEIDVKIDYYNFDEIRPNDVLIWIGNWKIPNFTDVKQKNIYTIYFNTEPDTVNDMASDEVWTYSRYIFDTFKPVLFTDKSKTQVIKYIPIVCEETVSFVPYHTKDDTMKLVFIGNLSYRQDKTSVLLHDEFMKENVKEVMNLWNDEDYNTFVSGKANIYLNLTKSGTNQLPSVRINKLLSHKCIIISEHTNETDEAIYEGLVIFCKLEDIENKYKELKSKSGDTLQQMADAIYSKFYTLFGGQNANKLIMTK